MAAWTGLAWLLWNLQALAAGALLEGHKSTAGADQRTETGFGSPAAHAMVLINPCVRTERSALWADMLVH